MDTSSLPLTRNISTTYTLSLITAFMMTVVSVAGLIYPSSMYPIKELRYSSVATDVVNVFIVLPVLLWSMLMARRDVHCHLSLHRVYSCFYVILAVCDLSAHRFPKRIHDL